MLHVSCSVSGLVHSPVQSWSSHLIGEGGGLPMTILVVASAFVSTALLAVVGLVSALSAGVRVLAITLLSIA